MWTATTLWRYQLGPEDSDFVRLTSVRDLVSEEAGWTIFPNRLSTQLRRFEATHGSVLAATIVTELALRVAGDDQRASDVLIEDDIADDAFLDLRDAFVSESSEGLIAAVTLSRKADGQRFRSTLVVLIDANDAVVSATSFDGLEPRLSVAEGIVMEGPDAEPVLVGRAPSGASLALLPIPPRLTQSRVVRGDHFPIRPHARYELTLPLRAEAPAITLTLRTEAISVTVDGRTASWFAPGGYRVLDVDAAQLRLSVLTHAAEYQVLDLGEAETATRWEDRLAYVELLTALGDVERAGREAEHELFAPRSNGEQALFQKVSWAIALAATFVAAERRADADSLIRPTAEFIQQQFSGPPRAMLLSKIQRVAFLHDIRIGQERVDRLLQGLAAVSSTEDRAALYYALIMAAFESCRKGAPWMDQVQTIHNAIASELNQFTDEQLHLGIRVLAYTIQLITSRAERVASAEFVPSPVPESLKPMLEHALAGDANANSNLGAAFGKGKDVRRSPRDAVYWYERAVALGSTMAAYNVGAMYRQGEGIEPDKVRAFERMLFAAERGHPEAATTLGLMFLEGEGVERDLERAVHWLSVGVERGDELANKNLAHLYFRGVGVLRDCAKARELIGDLVRRGDPQAMLLLRLIHEADC